MGGEEMNGGKRQKKRRLKGEHFLKSGESRRLR